MGPKCRAHNYWPYNRFGLVLTDGYITDMYTAQWVPEAVDEKFQISG